MYAHALTYPSLHKQPERRARRVRARRSTRSPQPLFLRGTTQHLRVVSRVRAARVSWAREIARGMLALANVAAAAAMLYVFF